MMRHQHHIRLQRGRRRLQQRPLGRPADVTRQQDHAVVAGDAQHAAVFVLGLTAARRRVQDLEIYPVPLPAQPVVAGRGASDGAAGGASSCSPGSCRRRLDRLPV